MTRTASSAAVTQHPGQAAHTCSTAQPASPSCSQLQDHEGKEHLQGEGTRTQMDTWMEKGRLHCKDKSHKGTKSPPYDRRSLTGLLSVAHAVSELTILMPCQATPLGEGSVSWKSLSQWCSDGQLPGCMMARPMRAANQPAAFSSLSLSQ